MYREEYRDRESESHLAREDHQDSKEQAPLPKGCMHQLSSEGDKQRGIEELVAEHSRQLLELNAEVTQ